MYVVTFYSYKGGVGRTMALVNVAAGLAEEGKRVLLVDFDLEAPGLPSFDILAAARGRHGIVDFVDAYRTTLSAPDVADYIVRCDSVESTIWLMPAGDTASPDYSDRLSNIDWEELYAEHEGYLLLDDLRQQWESYEGLGFDYVLIDSRTGHTDVGGICTRQLPDAVVVMFLPNDQNVDGLVPIVEGIREESLARREGSLPGIELHFCPSNIPDEYDEDGILERLLDTASRKLGYNDVLAENAVARASYGDGLGPEQPAALIRHRTSLSLLIDPMITRSKQGARLSKEYGRLRSSIEARNFADLDGALLTLDRLPNRFERARATGRSAVRRQFVKEAETIRRLHPHDVEVNTEAAEFFQLAGEFELEASARTVAIENGRATARNFLSRAIARLNTGRNDEAVEDLVQTLRSHDGRQFEFAPAVQLLEASGVMPDPIPTAQELFFSRATPIGAKMLLSTILMKDRGNLAAVADECLAHAEEPDIVPNRRTDLLGVAMLSLIGSGSFARAIDLSKRMELIRGGKGDGRVASEFNRCIALWGLEGARPTDRFAELEPRISVVSNPDANAHQCFALIANVLGDSERAVTELQRAERALLGGRLQFSCWRFLYVEDEVFEEDIAEMRQAIERGTPLVPPFLAEFAPERLNGME